MKKLIVLIIVGAVAAVVVPDAGAYGGPIGAPANRVTPRQDGPNGHGDDDDGWAGEGARCSSNAECDDDNVCTRDRCKHGRCSNKDAHDDRPCDDGNACTRGDRCDDGVCKGKRKHDGATCSDGNACTQSDTCQRGICTGADPVVCSASDQCHVAGACDPVSGLCSDPAAPDGIACDDIVTCSGLDTCQAGICTVPGALVETIAFSSNRLDPTGVPAVNSAEVYLMPPGGMNPDGSNLVRLTNNGTFSDLFPALSPDGKGRIVFDSNRNNAQGAPVNLVDLFLMKSDGSGDPQPLGRGSSASWSPDSQSIAFQRSATGAPEMELPINQNPGAPARDSDIFVARLCDLVAGTPPTNITNDPAKVDSDPDWRSDGQKIVFQSTDVGDSATAPISADLWVINPDGSGRAPLTSNAEEERSPAWSPDGKRIVFMCRRGLPAPGMVLPTFEICVVNADGTGLTQLTVNNLNDASPKFSPDGQEIVFHRGGGGGGNTQVFVMNADGSGTPAPLTGPPGISLFPDWGFVTQ